MTNHIDTVHFKNKVELPWSIEIGLVCLKTRQDNNVNDRIGLVYTEIETSLDLSDRVWFVIKIRQDNDVIERIDAFYIKNKIVIDQIGYGLWNNPNKTTRWPIL